MNSILLLFLNLLVKDKLKVYSEEIEKLHLFGTPEELYFFEKLNAKNF